MTPRELYWLAKARRLESWDHTAFLVMSIHNMLAKKPRGLEDFHPIRAKMKGRRGQFDTVSFQEFVEVLKSNQRT